MLNLEKEFLSIFENEFASTIEALSGVNTKIKHKNTKKISFLFSLVSEVILVKLKLNSPKHGSILLAFPVPFIINLYNKVLKIKGNNRKKINDDDLDMLKEVVENIFGAISNTIDFKGKNFKVSIEAVFLLKSNKYILENFYKIFEYSLFFNEKEYSLLFVIDDNVYKDLFFLDTNIHKNLLSSKKYNINLIIDSFLEVKVRVGKKYIPMSMLDDIKKGKMIDIETNPNFTVDIIVQKYIIAFAKVVIIDGKFGFQIDEVLEKPIEYEQIPFIENKTNLDPLLLLEVILGEKTLKVEEILDFEKGNIVDLGISCYDFFKMYLDNVFISCIDLKVHTNNTTKINVVPITNDTIVKLPNLSEEDKNALSSKKESNSYIYEDNFNTLSSYSDTMLYSILIKEHPQTIVVVLLNINDDLLIKNILSKFSEELLQEIIVRMARTKEISKDSLNIVSSTLLEDVKCKPKNDKVNGFDKVVSLLALCTNKNKILELVSQIDSGLSKSILREITKLQNT